MIKIKGSINNRIVIDGIKNIERATEKGIRAAIFEIGKDLKRTARESIVKKPKSGRVYKVRRNGRLVSHRSSAPGEAPANLSGSLKKSLFSKRIGSNKLLFGVTEGFGPPGTKGVSYGKRLELGIGIAARPFLFPAIEKNDRNIETRLASHIKEEIKKGR